MHSLRCQILLIRRILSPKRYTIIFFTIILNAYKFKLNVQKLLHTLTKLCRYSSYVANDLSIFAIKCLQYVAEQVFSRNKADFEKIKSVNDEHMENELIKCFSGLFSSIDEFDNTGMFSQFSLICVYI